MFSPAWATSTTVPPTLAPPSQEHGADYFAQYGSRILNSAADEPHAGIRGADHFFSGMSCPLPGSDEFFGAVIDAECGNRGAGAAGRSLSPHVTSPTPVVFLCYE